MNGIVNFIQNFFVLVSESAPWLLLGFFISGLITFVLPPSFLQKHLGGKNALSVLKGALIGAPIPLCSCSVIPVALGVRRAGASKGATTSFLIASPETGVDSIAVTYALLGPFMAVVRPVAAVTTAVITGLMVMFFERNNAEESTVHTAPSKACCGSHHKVETQKSTCCHAEKTPPTAFMQKLRHWFQFSFIEMVNDTAMWLLIGLVISAAMMTFVPESFLQKWGASPYAYVIMALIGVPMYICATSSTPLAVGLLFAGVSPGVILVFLLAGPATNVATLAIVKQALGKKVLAIYLSCLVSVSFLFGWLTDYLANFFHIGLRATIAQEYSESITPFSAICSVILLLLMAYVLYVKKFFGNATHCH